MDNQLTVHDTSLKDKLKFSELRYRRLFETAQDGILILCAESGKIVDANPCLKKILGYSQEELLGKELWQIGIFKDISYAKNTFQQLQTEGYIRYKDLPLQTKGGYIVDVEFVSNAYMVDTQRVIQCNIRDITDRRNIEKLAENKTKELERLSKSYIATQKAMINVMEDLKEAKTLIEVEKVKDDAMLDSIGEGLIGVNKEKKIMIINKAAETMLGWDMKDLLGLNIATLSLEDEEGQVVPLTNCPTNIALATGEMTKKAYFFVRKDKTRFPVAITVTPIKLGEKIIGAVDIFRDITREKEIDRAKSEFVSIASHQLRTPLGIAKWYIEAIRKEQYLDNVPKVAKDYLNEVYKSNERLLALVRDLLSIARIDQGKVRNTPQTICIIGLTKSVIKSMKILAAKKDMTIQLDLKKIHIPSVFIDSLRVQEVIENLIANAIAYSKSSEKIKVMIDTQDRNILIAVKDTGIGMSMNDKKRLFTKFFRSEKAVIKNTEGSGLGLYIVKSYVQGWGGNISVVSKEGKGSIFTVSIPINHCN